MLEKIEGIIIKTIDYGETHKIVTIFSKNVGKFSALARGAKKPKSRMAAVTQPFIYGQFFIYLNKGLSTVQQGEIISSQRGIREDIEKTAYAAYIVELTDKLLDEKAPDPFLYDQLYRTLCWIAEQDNSEIPIIMYELKMFQKGGFAPIVENCINCGSKTNAPFAFSLVEGGILCSKCRHNDEDAILLPNSVTKLLNLFANVGLERIGTISVKDGNRKLLRQILDAYYDHYGGYQLKSKRFLKQMDRLK